MEEITLQNVGGKILASSREVAERFGKQNKHVNESIKKLMVENSTVKNMFTKDGYKSNRGRMETEYLMDRDGFSLLVMGFAIDENLDIELTIDSAKIPTSEVDETVLTSTLLVAQAKAILFETKVMAKIKELMDSARANVNTFEETTEQIL